MGSKTCFNPRAALRVSEDPLPVRAHASGLDRDSVANVCQLVVVDRAQLAERVGGLSATRLDLVLAGIDIVLGR